MLKTAYKVHDGRLEGSRWCPSPNYNERASQANIDVLVIHNISLPPAQFCNGYIEAFFQNRLPVSEHSYFAEIAELQVSAHLLVTRNGDVIQFVNLNDRAWHAGESCFEGRVNCNDFSIGIEMEGTDDLPYTYTQYQVLARVANSLIEAYPQISRNSIVGHVDIAPGRKTDPGDSFNWLYFEQLFCEFKPKS
ncbi:1,6-anhydro-N-acetylmuramyl-L-alanine amidase AmpD [Neptunomonas japonica]|uniref:1,6-anhydro-N-acetylmuramyl-L-alanine amidase AmpD n=1 Tax=Neptunomonas japonica JAMM 1380 TaxID=1441457 RepID=A0A7R6SV18_9GAMM|nr:N-acetyl-anhydromuranmyl-L-alanine amidase [Neptunomonas japonica JAMM 1380]